MAGAGIGFTFDEQRNTRVAARPGGRALRARRRRGADGRGVRRRRLRSRRTLHALRARRPDDPQRADHRGGRRDGVPVPGSRRARHDRAARQCPHHRRRRHGRAARRCAPATSTSITRDDGRTLQQATLAGKSAIELAGQAAAPGQQLTGEFITIDLLADGSIKNLASRDNVRRDPAGREGRAGAHHPRRAADRIGRAGAGPDGDEVPGQRRVPRGRGEGSRRPRGAGPSAGRTAQPDHRPARGSPLHRQLPLRGRRLARAERGGGVSHHLERARPARARQQPAAERERREHPHRRRRDRHHAGAAADGRQGQRPQRAAADQGQGRRRASGRDCWATPTP